MKFINIIKFLIILILGLLIGVFGSIQWKDYKIEDDKRRMDAMNNQILEGYNINPIKISIDYSKKISIGSPLVFGGSHAPESYQVDAWEKINEIGITLIRKDFFMQNTLPSNITLDDYKKNLGNVQDPENWRKDKINMMSSYFINAKKYGMKTIGVVEYAPKWLTYNNTINGVPKDWEVYKDIVKKNYKIHRNNLDYIEVWNEPNFKFFFNVENSNLSVEDAYHDLYYNTYLAIREVDLEINDGKIIPIGGPAGYNPSDTAILEKLLSSPLTKDRVDFISYHNYDAKHLKEPSWIYYKQILSKYNKNDLPIFLTEWNSEPDSRTLSTLHTSNEAIPYVGNKFVDFLKMGLKGANYHVIESLDINLPNEGEGYMGFYRWKNNSAYLLPQAKVWRLMSKKMKLGEGENSIYDVNSDINEIDGLGFKNISNEYGLILVNNNENPKLSKLILTNLRVNKYSKLNIYYADKNNQSIEPNYSGEIKVNNGHVELIINIPGKSVVGALITNENNWLNNF